MSHSLTLGDLLLTDSFPAADGYVFNVAADGFDFGSPESAKQIVTSLLSDGDLVRTTRKGNREVTFGVQITGPSLASVAAGEAALRAELGKGNLLTWQPPDTMSEATVFEVIDSDFRQKFDDLDELGRRRVFIVTLTCGPFVRTVEPVMLDALPLPSSESTVSVDTCDSATGWTGTRSGVSEPINTTFIPGAVGVVELDSNVTSPEMWTLKRTGSVDFSTTPYLIAEIRTLSNQQGLRVSVTATGTSGIQAPLPILSSRLMTDGNAFYRVVFDARGITTASALTFSHTSIQGEPWQGMYIRQVSRTNVPPSQTVRQQTRIINVGGTERTPASIHVTSADGTTPLSTTIVHTSPEDGSGYSPPLRRWRISGNTTTTDASTFSGTREPIYPASFVAKVPTAALPEGGYLAAAFLRCTTAATVPIYWNIGTVPPGGTRQGDVTDLTRWTFTANVWQLVPLGVVSLPSIRTVSGEVQIDIVRDATSSAAVEIDEAWLFRIEDDCALSVVNVATTNLWLDSPDVNSPVPTIWVGDSETVRTHPGTGLVAQGNHILRAEGTAVFTASSNSNNPMTSAKAYRRFPYNVVA